MSSPANLAPLRDHVIIGIDPGFTGAMAVLVQRAPQTVYNLERIVDPPTTKNKKGKTQFIPREMVREVIAAEGLGAEGASIRACVELAGARPGEGVSSAFRYGYGSGLWVGILEGLGIHVTFVTAATWKRRAGLIHASKDASRQLAASLHPHHAALFARKKDHGRAEAALIALFGVAVIS